MPVTPRQRARTSHHLKMVYKFKQKTKNHQKSEIMKRTGPTKQSTKLLIEKLEKKAVSEKQAVWKAIADKIALPTRQRAKVNISKLAFLNKKFPDKIFTVPGKVLGETAIEAKLEVIAMSYSANAKKAIEAKGKALLLKDALGKKFEAAKLMITA